MKKDRKFGVRSLYFYLTIAFIVIFLVIIISTLLYVQFVNKHVSSMETEITIGKEIVEDINQNRDLRILTKSAIIYGLLIGVSLILIVTSHIIKPIRKITFATKEVASGNFDVKVTSRRKDELGKLADNFNIMVKELNSIEYLRKDFISNVSHEMKTPIASIQGFAKLLKDEKTSEEEKREYINIILEESTRLSNLSSNIMKLSKFENQSIITNKKEFRLDEQIRKAIIMLQEKIEEKKIDVVLKTDKIIIVEDEDLLMEIWLNLIGNSIKYSKENGKIEIKILEESDFIKISIKDNGIGIPKDKQDRIFEKFYQAEKSHKNEGSGLGLSIVKRIVELVDGKLNFESEEGEGTTFNVVLKKV